MDRDQMKSVEVFDPVKKCRYQVLLPIQKTEIENEENSNDEETTIWTTNEDSPVPNITIWTHTETLALINIFSLFKDKFKDFKKRKDRWSFISEELAKIGIHKIAEKCEIKWKNLLRIYRQHKIGNKPSGKFEFFNELDHIVANDNQYKYVIQFNNSAKATKSSNADPNSKNKVSAIRDCSKEITCRKRLKCRCLKSEKQKRHEDRMAIMTKKMEIEERKVRAFEDYLKFLKTNTRST